MNFANTVRQHWAALRALLVFTVILGIGYPVLIWLVALAPSLHNKAEGSIITVGGKPVGSRLIGQSFTDSSGNPLPQYFQSRPSAAGRSRAEAVVPHPEERPKAASRRMGHRCMWPWFETREDALLTMRAEIYFPTVYGPPFSSARA